jgi:hypothetical protein
MPDTEQTTEGTNLVADSFLLYPEATKQRLQQPSKIRRRMKVLAYRMANYGNLEIL